MASIVENAKEFFTACETGKGWDGCKAFCKSDATFSAQAEPLADVKTLQQYCEWMKGLYTPLPNASYDIESFAVDHERNNVAAYAVFSATNTGPGGQHLRREEVSPSQQRQVGPNEGRPCGQTLARRRQRVAAKDIANRLIGNHVPKI